MSYTVTWEERGCYKRFTGKVSFQEYARSQEEVTGDARIDEAKYIINDLLGLDGYTVTPDQAEYAAAFTRGPSYSNPWLRIAFVTTDTKIILLLMIVQRLSSLEVGAFPTVEEARAWGLAARS
jgi:hypothetical protein